MTPCQPQMDRQLCYPILANMFGDAISDKALSATTKNSTALMKNTYAGMIHEVPGVGAVSASMARHARTCLPAIDSFADQATGPALIFCIDGKQPWSSRQSVRIGLSVGDSAAADGLGSNILIWYAAAESRCPEQHTPRVHRRHALGDILDGHRIRSPPFAPITGMMIIGLT